MNLLFLNLKTFSATGGIEKFNRSYCKALQENCTQNGWGLQVLSAYDSYSDDQYLSGAFFTGYKGRRWRFVLAAVWAMLRADVVIYGHINLALLMRIGRWMGKRRICLTHGREVWEPLSPLALQELRRCREIWSVSRFTAGIMEADKGIRPQQIRIFPNTLDPNFGADKGLISPALLRYRYGIQPQEKVILTVCRLTSSEKSKGYDLVLAALPNICQKMPNTRYVLAGKWDEAEKKRIDSIIKGLNLPNVALLTGFVEDHELIALYRMSDVFILPSRKEGFGIVFLEAAWAGLPVIGGNRDGSTEALMGGRLGRLVDPESREEIEAAILSALSEDNQEAEKTARQQLVTEQFGFAAFCRRQQQLIAGATALNE